MRRKVRVKLGLRGWGERVSRNKWGRERAGDGLQVDFLLAAWEPESVGLEGAEDSDFGRAH